MATAQFEAVLEQMQEKGSPNLSPTRGAERFAMQSQELAAHAGVHRNTLLKHPGAAKLQKYMRNLMRITSAASAVQPNIDSALFFVKNTPIPAFRHKTAFQLLDEGRTEDVVEYFASIESGFAG